MSKGVMMVRFRSTGHDSDAVSYLEAPTRNSFRPFPANYEMIPDYV